MAIKGNAYTKTTWAFEERPVASSKLNSWDDRIEAALELIHFLLSLAWGGGNGVVRGATAEDLEVAAKDPPSMRAEVGPGYAFIGNYPYKLAAATDTAEVTAPTTDPRIDLVQARLATWDVSVKTGTEAASPSPPDPDTDCIALAQLYLRPGMTCIKDTDDSTNGYIIDARTFL
ncbi:MAG TPA: hypothetical protein HPP83_10285 [Candidatus Hydrogenedentes bacterium]|nr:hypothetical protein [Candidatus Hydrogenedentota bacterium]